MTYKLTNPPIDERSRELWLQHVAGFIIFQDMRKYAMDRIPRNADDKEKELIIKGIDDAIYGLMMIMDGVTGSLSNEDYVVTFKNIIRLENNGKIIQEINTLDGDGMCMGFHSWKEENFGEDNLYPVVKK
jgi:hypothetical protein